MPVLDKDEVKAWPKAKVEKELRGCRDDVASIVESKGMTLGQPGWLAKLDAAETERVTGNQQSLNVLAERMDEILADEKTEGSFSRLGEFLDEPDPAHRHPGHQRAEALKKSGVRAIDGDVRDVGALFLDSDAYKAYVEQGTLGKPVKVPVGSVFGPGIEGIGEMPGMQATLFDSTGFPSRPDFRDGALVDTLYQANNIGPLMPQGSTDSDSIKYPVETVTATGAAEVAEGSSKPEAQISFADTTEPVQTIAVLLPMTTRSLTNQPFLRSYINARLRLFVQMREDSQLLNGNGTTPNLKGIFNRSGINTATSYSIGGANPDQALVEAIFHASMRVQDAFLQPDAAVMKGSTWEKARLAKDANRNYLLGPANDDGPPRVWGLRVVINANMPAESATNKDVLVGAWATAAMVVRRGGIELALSESHSTFFAENKVMLRAEEEVALLVFRPAGFAAVTSAA